MDLTVLCFLFICCPSIRASPAKPTPALGPGLESIPACPVCAGISSHRILLNRRASDTPQFRVCRINCIRSLEKSSIHYHQSWLCFWLYLQSHSYLHGCKQLCPDLGSFPGVPKHLDPAHTYIASHGTRAEWD